MDVYESRKGFHGEPFGDYAWELLGRIRARMDVLVITDFLVRELESRYPVEKINGMFLLFQAFLEKITLRPEQFSEAKRVASAYDVPFGDAVHAIAARDFRLVLITRDHHFKKLTFLALSWKPEQLL